jgi:hypothetical protein
MGLSCYRGPDTYGKGCTTIFKKYDCRSGYTDNGCTCGRGASSLGASKMDCPSGYFLNSDLGRCYKKCPKGYTNTGETCFRGASTLGMSKMSCESGEFKTGARCYKSCPSGYTNTGETCFKPASTRGIDSMSCKAGEFQSGVRCYDNDTCAADREFWGGLCYKKCPAGSTRTAVSTCVHDIHWRGNTHLFIVNRALELLAKSSDPVAVAAAKKMNEKDCRTSWETGLWNGDDGALADAPGKAAGSHFYDGSGKDEQGGWTPVVTYTIARQEQTANGNARTRAQARIDDVVKEVKACENLGLALHYLTDMTQPMHATTFSGISIPTMLHPVLEDYVPSLQAGFPKVTAWDERWTGKLPDEVFLEASKKSADLAPGLMATLKDDGTNCTMTPEGGITYSGYCFLNVPRVNAALAQIVTDGYQSTASYIYAVFNNAQSGTP